MIEATDSYDAETVEEDSCIIDDTEERLLTEADSLGELMGTFRSRVSSRLIGDLEWEEIRTCARGLPVTLAAVPFEFALPLHDPQPRADFGISIVAGKRSGPFFGEGGGPLQNPALASPSIGCMLDEMAREESPLNRTAGLKLVLRYDMDAASDHAFPVPGLFLHPLANTFDGDGAGQRLQDLKIVLDAIDDAVGWEPDAAERQCIEQTYMALAPETRIAGIGALSSRGRGIRLMLQGFRKMCDVTAFLERAGHAEQCSAADAVGSFLEERGAFANIWVHLDVNASGIEPCFGLSFAQEREWMTGGRHWRGLIESLRAQHLCVPEKLSELDKWLSGHETWFGRSGRYVLIPYIHHVKYILVGGRVEQIKAYAVWMLCFLSQTGRSSGSS